MLEAIMEKQFGVKLNPFTPCASYYEDMDYVEYILSDVITVAERIDPFLTLLWDKNRDNVIGFKLKGFRNFFEKTLKPLYDLKNEEFVALSSALEIFYTEQASKLLEQLNVDQQEKQRRAYRQALKLASNDNARLFEVPRKLVA